MKKLNDFVCPYIKSKGFICLAISMGIVFSLAGCTVITGVYDENTYTIKPANLNIVRGQPLEIYFQNLPYLSQKNTDIEAWRSTQLFSSVTETRMDKPSVHGYFLRVNCDRRDWYSVQDAPVTTFMLSVLSAFTLPTEDYTRPDCSLVMYENGIEIASTSVRFEYRKWSAGWGLLPHYFKRPSIYATHARTEANIRVRNMMAALTKEVK